jgi:hypothetical protein
VRVPFKRYTADSHRFRAATMRFLIAMLLWTLLLVLAWPLALLVLVLWPVLWLLSIPFRVVGALMEALLGLIRAVLFLPARLLGGSAR